MLGNAGAALPRGAWPTSPWRARALRAAHEAHLAEPSRADEASRARAARRAIELTEGQPSVAFLDRGARASGLRGRPSFGSDGRRLDLYAATGPTNRTTGWSFADRPSYNLPR
jgi:hypothetical protein